MSNVLTDEQKVTLVKETDGLVQVHQHKIEKFSKIESLKIQEAPIMVTYQRTERKLRKI